MQKFSYRKIILIFIILYNIFSNNLAKLCYGSSLEINEEHFQNDVQLGKLYFLEAVSLEEGGELKEAAIKYKEATRNGHAKAAYSLAQLYFNGRGVEQSEKKGRKYLKMAKLNGYNIIQEKSDAIQLNDQVVENNPLIQSQNRVDKFRTIGEFAKLVNFYGKNLQLGFDLLSIPLSVFGYEDIGKNLEKLSLISKFFGGISKITSGTTDTIITKDKKHLLTAAIGLTQAGSSYLQYGAKKRYDQLKLEKIKLEEELEDLQQSKVKIEESLKERTNQAIDELESKKLEKALNEARRNYQKISTHYNSITTQQKYCSFQTLGLVCTEEVCDKTFTDLKDDKFTLQEALTKNLMSVTVGSAVKKFLSETIKENQEEVREHLQQLFDNVKRKLKDTKLSDFIKTIEEGDNKSKIFTGMESELEIS